MSTTSLVLDSEIRDWVFIPIVLVMFFVGILRTNIAVLLQAKKKPKIEDVIDLQKLARSAAFKRGGKFLTADAFAMRKAYFNDKEHGIFKEDPTRKMANPAQDPDMMMDMVKGNMSMILPQILLMTWVNQFFYGFLTTQVPFPLTLNFKEMTQRGVELSSLDATWISSLSWYFLVVYGIRGAQILIMGDGSAPPDEMAMQQQMSQQQGPKPDMNQVFKNERESIELIEYEFELEGIESKLLGHKLHQA